MTDPGLQSLHDWLVTTIASIEEMEQQEEEDTMKITITPAGDVVFDVDDIKEAVELAAQLRNGKPAPTKKAKPAKTNDLTPALADTYEHLVDLDTTEGVSPTLLAEAFGIKASAMDQRLRQLRNRGLVENVSRGLWRVVK